MGDGSCNVLQLAWLQSVGKGNIIGTFLFVDHASLGGSNAHASLNLYLAGSGVPIGRVRYVLILAI